MAIKDEIHESAWIKEGARSIGGVLGRDRQHGSRLGLVAFALAAYGFSIFSWASCTDDTSSQVDIVTHNDVTRVVGKTGATVEHETGAQVEVPAGALGEDVTISLGEVPADELGKRLPALPAGLKVRGPMIAFLPHGQLFAKAVSITLPFTDNGKGAPSLLRLPLGGTSWSKMAGVTSSTLRVIGKTKTFSFYVVAQPSGMTDAHLPHPVADGGMPDQDSATALDGAVAHGDLGQGADVRPVHDTTAVGRCNASNCVGCCQSDVCQPGNTTAACGQSGAVCMACASAMFCNGGICGMSDQDSSIASDGAVAHRDLGQGVDVRPVHDATAVGGCNASNCVGCCQSGVCQPGDTNVACGRSGAVCMACASARSCNGGICQ